jgi:hypothetical protein
MGKADYYRSGEWNFFCDLCGAKNKSGDAMLTWNGLRVCKHHKEIRNPQDFLRGVRDDQAAPWTRPEKEPETWVPAPSSCTLRGKNSIPSWAVPGCAIPSYYNNSFLPSQPEAGRPNCTLEGVNCLPSFAVPGCSIPSYNNLEIGDHPLIPNDVNLPGRSPVDTEIGII